MKKKSKIVTGILFLSLFTLVACKDSTGTSTAGEGIVPPGEAIDVSDLDSLDIDYQLQGECYAFSSEKNEQPSNGEWHSPNRPLKTNGRFTKGKLYLVAEEQPVKYGDTDLVGYKLYLVNTTNKKAVFWAQDSRLSIITEVVDEYGNWKPITYLPSSFCGNSYHTITLDKNEYWEFVQPVYTGEFETKLRYRLDGQEDGQIIISNEITTQINPGQMNPERKEGNRGGGNLMDPYSL